MRITFTDNGSFDIEDSIVPFFHLLDGHSDSVWDLILQQTQRLLTDQLRSDLAHRLVGNSILIVILRTVWQILKQQLRHLVRILVSQSRNRNDLRKWTDIFIGIDGLGNDLLVFHGIDLVDRQNHRGFHLG